jgi:hypothetical protein
VGVVDTGSRFTRCCAGHAGSGGANACSGHACSGGANAGGGGCRCSWWCCAHMLQGDVGYRCHLPNITASLRLYPASHACSGGANACIADRRLYPASHPPHTPPLLTSSSCSLLCIQALLPATSASDVPALLRWGRATATQREGRFLATVFFGVRAACPHTSLSHTRSLTRTLSLPACLPACLCLSVSVCLSNHELCHTPLNGLSVSVCLSNGLSLCLCLSPYPSLSNHELCHTPLNGLSVSVCLSNGLSLCLCLSPTLLHY